MKKLVLKDKFGQVIRVFQCEAKRIYLIYHKKKGRLDFCSSPDFFEKDSFILIDELEVNKIQKAVPVPFMQAVLELCDGNINLRPSLSRLESHTQNIWKVFSFVAAAYAVLIAGLYGLSQLGPSKEKKMLEQQIVKIIKPPAVIKPEKVVVGSKEMFFRDAKEPMKKKILKKSLKKMGALSALGSLSKKDSLQRSGLNLGADKVSAGPGLGAIASHSGSGGVQDSLYSKGMITAALGSGGNIRGGGGHGTKGTERGGGSAGYGELSLIGSGGTEDLSSSSVLSSQGGTFDIGVIEREIIKKIGRIRKCYDMALKTKPDLKGLFKVYFSVSSKGRVAFSKVRPSSEIRFQKISSCILDVINLIHFPVQLTASVGINYDFDLSALETEGGE